jgi:hypothetical protein
LRTEERFKCSVSREESEEAASSKAGTFVPKGPSDDESLNRFFNGYSEHGVGRSMDGLEQDAPAT